MRKKPPTLSYETPERESGFDSSRHAGGRPLVAWYHVAVTAVLTFVAGAILLYLLAGVFRF